MGAVAIFGRPERLPLKVGPLLLPIVGLAQHFLGPGQERGIFLDIIAAAGHGVLDIRSGEPLRLLQLDQDGGQFLLGGGQGADGLLDLGTGRVCGRFVQERVLRVVINLAGVLGGSGDRLPIVPVESVELSLRFLSSVHQELMRLPLDRAMLLGELLGPFDPDDLLPARILLHAAQEPAHHQHRHHRHTEGRQPPLPSDAEPLIVQQRRDQRSHHRPSKVAGAADAGHRADEGNQQEVDQQAAHPGGNELGRQEAAIEEDPQRGRGHDSTDRPGSAGEVAQDQSMALDFRRLEDHRQAAAAQTGDQVNEQKTPVSPHAFQQRPDHVKRVHIQADVDHAKVNETSGEQAPPLTVDQVGSLERARLMNDGLRTAGQEGVGFSLREGVVHQADQKEHQVDSDQYQGDHRSRGGQQGAAELLAPLPVVGVERHGLRPLDDGGLGTRHLAGADLGHVPGIAHHLLALGRQDVALPAALDPVG